MKRVLTIIIVGFLAGLAGAYTFKVITPDQIVVAEPQQSSPGALVNNTPRESATPTYQPRRPAADIPNTDFILASEASTKSVVYIKNISKNLMKALSN